MNLHLRDGRLPPELPVGQRWGAMTMYLARSVFHRPGSASTAERLASRHSRTVTLAR
jgi:hypothetical protein